MLNEAQTQYLDSRNDDPGWFRQLFASSPDPVWIIDGNHFVECNDAAIRTLGYSSHKELLNLHPSKLSPPTQADGEDSYTKAERMMSIAVERGLHRFEWIHTKADGTEFFAEVTLSAIKLADKQVIYCVWRDIAERKQAEEKFQKFFNRWLEWCSISNIDGDQLLASAHDITQSDLIEASLRVSEEKLRGLYELCPMGIALTDMQGRYIEFNQAFQEICGYPLAELMTLDYWALTPRKYEAEEARQIESLQRTGYYGPYEKEYIRKDGSLVPLQLNGMLITGRDGQKYIWSIVQDISDRKLTEERIERLANFDLLTGLPNRTLLIDHFNYALSLAKRSGEKMAVMFIDLDHFKDINDTLGHSAGDGLLMETARRLKVVLRQEDTLFRQGGDEFILILPNTDADGAAVLASKLTDIVSEPFYFDQQELVITPSIGIAIFPDNGESLEILSKSADAAMYRAKHDGRNNFRFFSPEMQTLSARNLKLASALRQALSRNELSLHYQPQLSLLDGHVVGVEALLRWNHPELGMVAPAEFIPIAEDTGQIISIGEWVLHTAAKQLKTWIDKGLPAMVMAVNLSAVQFRQPSIAELVVRILDDIGLPHYYLELELTEAATMKNPSAAKAIMKDLYDNGIKMSIDDFGTGYSSLNYLKQFKVHKLKIDRSFVRDLTDDPDDKAIVTAIINMASSLGMQTIAEGVETAGQLAFLRLQGCNEVQGYYFSEPLTADQFEEFANTRNTPKSR